MLSESVSSRKTRRVSSPSSVCSPLSLPMRSQLTGPRVGYLAIYILGIASGLYILPPDPAFFAVLYRPPPRHAAPQQVELKRNKVWESKPGKLANLLGSYAVVWWTVFAVVRWASGVEVSRRLVRVVPAPISRSHVG